MAYRTQSPDTSEQVDRLQFEMLRRWTPGQRLARARALSRDQMRWAWSGLKRAYPHLGERELQIKAVELWYGEELATKLKLALEARDAKRALNEEGIED